MQSHVVRRSCGLVLLILLCLMGLAQSCDPRAATGRPTGGNAGAPAGQVPQGFGAGWTKNADWLPVIMQPQPIVEFPAKGLSLVNPRNLLQQLPPPPAKAASYNPADLLKDGGAYDTVLPNNKVSVSGTRGVYAPDWPLGSSHPLAQAAYAIYRFPLSDYEQQATVGFTWTTAPTDWSTFYVGFANVAHGRWDWYTGPADGVLTVAAFDHYYYPNGDVLVAVVLLGTDPLSLSQVEIGASESRYLGMGIGTATPPDDLPALQPLDPADSCPLPSSVDLRPFCAPVADQQNVGACTAFALANGVYNALLAQLYSGYGWDVNRPWYQAGPKYIYFKSGTAQGMDYGEGRYFPDTIQNMIDFGTASEQHAPFDFKSTENWGPEADADAALFRPDGFSYVNTSVFGGIETMKALLAITQRPLLVGVEAGWDWATYMPGTVLDQSPGAENHAVCIVGYDDSKGASGAFLVRNSWGEYWGEGGCCWVSYRSFTGSKQVYTLRENFDPAVVERFTGKPVDSVPGAPSIPPPNSLQASDGAYSDHVALSWTAVPAATGYRIYRDDKAELLHEVGLVTQWDDTTLTTLCAHIYWVTALKGAEESLPVTFDTGYLARPPVPVPPGDWAMFGRDLKHQRRSPYTGPATPEVKWTATCGTDSPQPGNLEPVMDYYGRLYVSTGSGLKCFGPTLPGDSYGYTYWNYDAPDSATASYGAAIGNNAVYMGDDAGLLSALDYTGRQLWTFDAGSGICTPPVVAADGTIYCGTLDGLLYAIRPDGTQKWHYDAGGAVVGAPAIDDAGALYFGSRADKLIKGADAGDHFALAWEYACAGDVDGSPTIGADGVYFMCQTLADSLNKVYKLDLDGNLQPGWPFTGSAGPGISPRYTTSCALAADGTLYVAAYEVLLALNPDGSTKWMFDAPDAQYLMECSPTVGGDGTVYVVSRKMAWQNYARLYALNPADGTEKWQLQPNIDQDNAHSLGPSIDASGMLYVGSTFGYLYAIGEAD
jgi:outer membrane protein assembly factor BamB